jgi:hypothetical protein
MKKNPTKPASTKPLPQLHPERLEARREAGRCRICRELTNAANRVCGRHYPFGRSTATWTVLAVKGVDLKESTGVKRLLAGNLVMRIVVGIRQFF